MADEKTDQDDAAKPATDAVKAKSSPLPLILGLAVTLGIGVGGALLAMNVLFPKQDQAQTAKDESGGSSIDVKTTKEILIGDLITNISNQDGRRYVKVTCAVWMSQEDAAKVQGTGGEGEIQVKRLMQMALEEQLKRYELADLTGRGIIAALTQDFTVVLDDVLRAQFPDQPKDHRFIRRVLLNNLLVQ